MRSSQLDEPLQVQLCSAFVTAMLEGRLPAGTRLESQKKAPRFFRRRGFFYLANSVRVSQ